jgi:serine protease Do
VLVASVQRGGPADRAGIAAGDLMVRLGERTIDQPEDVLGATLEYEPGTRVPSTSCAKGSARPQRGARPASVARPQPQRG